MHRVISAEFSPRSLYVSVGSLEAFGEIRARDWPRQWSRLREPGSIELWMGRLYLCISRSRRSPAELTAAGEETPPTPNGEVCQILAFKRPVGAALGRSGSALEREPALSWLLAATSTSADERQSGSGARPALQEAPNLGRAGVTV